MRNHELGKKFSDPLSWELNDTNLTVVQAYFW